MPRIVYGLVRALHSHRIELPDPARDAAAERPDACTLCHLDRSRAWAAREHARMFEPGASDAPKTTATGPAAGDELPEVARAVLAGDPIERALAAAALGSTEARFERAFTPRLLGLLADVMLADPYPAVRDIAARSLRARLSPTHPLLAAELGRTFVATARPAERARALEPVLLELGPEGITPPDLPVRERLRALAARTIIEIGE